MYFWCTSGALNSFVNAVVLNRVNGPSVALDFAGPMEDGQVEGVQILSRSIHLRPRISVCSQFSSPILIPVNQIMFSNLLQSAFTPGIVGNL
jgi:hypothetical protein